MLFGLLLAVGSMAGAFEDNAHSYCSTTTARTCNVDADCPGAETCMAALGCADGVDNDGDGFTDTADPDCLVEMYCQDGADNDGDGNTDGADTDCQCLDDVFNAGNCTANDVSFVTIGLGIQDDGCVSTADTVTIFLGAELETTATTRYDIGMWVDLDGGNARGDNPAGTPGICSRMILQPTAAPPNHDPFFPGSCSVNTSTPCDFHTDCPLFNLAGDPPGEICEIDAFRLEDTDKCGEISKNDTDPGGGAEHADFIWPFPVTLPCTTNPTPDGFVALGRCSTWSNSAAGIACQSVADAGPETTSKCRCDETDAGLVTNIPLPEVSTTCSCDSPTTVPPGFPVTCTVSYANAASCTVDAATPERFQCGTAGYLRLDVDDGAAAGALSGICLDTGNCSVTTATACTVDADCPVAETCVSRGQCSVTTTTSCSSFADCPGGEKCLLPTCDADADCPNGGTCSVDGGLGTVETVGGNCSTTTTTECTVDADCPGGETCEIAGGLHWTPASSGGPSLGIVGPGDAGSLEFVYTVDSGAGDGTITLSFTPKWVNGGACSTTTSTSCQSDADCPGGETCVPDFTANPRDQTVIQSTCSINVDATHVLVPAFRALDAGGQVVLEWETASEVGTLGFDVVRWDEAKGVWEKVNKTLLPALQHAPGGVYRMTDPAAAPAAGTLTYKLVEVDVNGIHRASAPYRVEIEPDPKAGAEAAFAATAREPSPRMLARLAAGEEEAPSAGRAKAGAGARAKIAVEEPGLYFLGTAEIAAALGQPAAKTSNDVRDGRLRLTNQGADVAWQAAGDGSGIFFYGEAIDSQFTRANVYWLESGPGVRMAVLGGLAPATAAPPQSFADTVHREEDRLGRPAVALDPLDDYWFWDGILTGIPPHQRKSFTLDVPGVAAAPGDATLAVTLYGFTNPLLSVEHRSEIRWNGQVIGEVSALGKGSHTVEVSLAQSLLQEGANTVEVVGLAGQFFVDSFDVGYQRSYRASADRLALRGDGHSVVTVTGLSSGDARVYEISDPRRPRVVGATRVDLGGDGTYRVSFAPATPDAAYFVTVAGAVPSAVPVRRGVASGLRDGRTRAEYVVIAPAQLTAAAEALADYRRSTGLTALVVGVEDAFDELNHGIADPRALRELLSFAYRNWRQPPRYVVLAGKGSYDYRDVLGLGGNLVPPLMASTASGLVAADNAFGDVEGDDGLPEIAVGRLPVLTAAELRAYLAKISAYESSPGGAWARQVLMVADDADGAGDFTADSQALTALVPPGLAVDSVLLAHPFTPAQARQRIMDDLREGALLVNYVGHGGPDRMATEGLLTTADVPLLDNAERLPVVTALTCNLGMFAFPGYSSLGESLVLHGDGGAAALWGPMGLSMNLQAVGMGDHLIEAILGADEPALGDALRAALAAFVRSGGDRDLLRTYGLLGDPALKMK